MDLKTVKETVAKLLCLARDDAATQGEIDNAMRFATRLMCQYHIDENDCHQAAAQAEAYQFAQEGAYSNGARFCAWEFALARFVNDFLGSTKYYQEGNVTEKTAAGTLRYDDKGRVIRRGRIVFYGVVEEAEMAADMFARWSLIIATMARMKFGSALRSAGGHYGDGFVAGMQAKLRESRLDNQTDNGTHALVVRSNAIAAVKKEQAALWLRKEQGIRLVSSRGSGRTSSNPGAYQSGKADGYKASVTRPSVTRKLT